MSVILRPLIKNSMHSYQTLETQMTRISASTRAPVRQAAPPPREEPVQYEEKVDEIIEQEQPIPQRFDHIPRVIEQPLVVIVN